MGTAQAGVDFCSHCTMGYRHPCVTLEEAQGCGNYLPPPSYDISQEAAQTMLNTLVMLTNCNLPHRPSPPSRLPSPKQANDRYNAMTPARFRECLDALHWTQRGLARILNRPEGTVRQWARGAVRIPDDVAAWLEQNARFMQSAPIPRR